MAEETTQPEEQKGGMGKMLMFGGIGVVLLVAGVFVGPMVQNMISPPPPAEAAEAEEAAPSNDPPIYQSLHPPMVVNFKDENGDTHFMQVTMEVMSRDQVVINHVREHTPAIRNALLLLFGGAIYEEIVTREGKEQMLADGLAEVQRVIEENTGKTGVEALYFTALVVQ